MYTIALFEGSGYDTAVAKVNVTLVEPTVHYLTTDKEEYEYNEPIMVTVSDFSSAYSWVGLYDKGSTPGSSNPSYYWYDNASVGGYVQGTAYNILDRTFSDFVNPISTEGGEFDIILFGDGEYTTIIDKVTITINPCTVPNSITMNKTENPAVYKYGEQILVIRLHLLDYMIELLVI